jgi:hypothetical protein
MYINSEVVVLEAAPRGEVLDTLNRDQYLAPGKGKNEGANREFSP